MSSVAKDQVRAAVPNQYQPRARVVGEVVVRPLKGIKVNDWNPNTMTPELMASMQHGFVQDGWLASQALLIWRTDETGAKRNMVIDGEHRYLTAVACGLTRGPMVMMDGLTEAEAKKLTVKLNQRRGSWDASKLGEVLRGLGEHEALSALDLGFSDRQLGQLMTLPKEEVVPLGDDAVPRAPDGPGDQGAAPDGPALTLPVKLLLNQQQHTTFMQHVEQLSRAFGLKNVTDTVLEAVRRQHAGLPATSAPAVP